MDEAALTDDAFLGGRLRLWQPKRGYRAATDPVLLAAACRARPGQRVLDVGAGVGTAAFCLGARVGGVALEGVEREPEMAALSERNAERNGLAWRCAAADIAAAPDWLRTASYDHVITNPPFFEPGRGGASDDRLRDGANRETTPLSAWLDFCLRRLRSRGELTVIHRAERLPEILVALSGRAGDAAALPLWPRAGRDAKRVIVRAVKDAKAPFRLAPGLLLHDGAGDGFSEAAEAVLRRSAPLDF